MDIQTVIFDSDGTLVDTERLSITVLCEHLGRSGIQIPVNQAVQDWSGEDLHQVLRDVQSDSNVTLHPEFLDEFRELQLQRLRSEVQPIGGAAELLSSLTKPRCVASNAPVVKVEMCLRATGLIRHFEDDKLFSAYQVNSWKPNPDVFLHAANKMNTPPDRCAVVEDSAAGVQAGLAAGMHVFAYDPESKLDGIDGVKRVTSLLELVELLNR